MITYKYEVVNTSKKWSDAESHCKSLKGHLASFSSEEQQAAVVSKTVDNYRYWIGFSDSEEERKWKWSDGSSFFWLNWANGQPNGHRDENCVLLKDGRWWDRQCDIEFYFVCKIPGM